MIGLFRRRANTAIIDRLHLGIVAASRAPSLYLDIGSRGLGVPDTIDGRFECLTLHAVLLLRRLQTCEAPGPDVAQHLVDTVFTHFDRSFREMGVGDTSVPKRMRTVVEAFLGRSTAYDAALRGADGAAAGSSPEGAAGMTPGDDPLAAALLRNVYSARTDEADAARRLAAYAAATATAMGGAPLQALIDGAVPWLDAGAFATETA